MESTTPVKAIQDFFSKDGGRPVTMTELRALNTEERQELGRLCAAAMGKTIAAA